MLYPSLRRSDYQNNSITILFGSPRALTRNSCKSPENNSTGVCFALSGPLSRDGRGATDSYQPKNNSVQISLCKKPWPQGALTGFPVRAPKNISKITCPTSKYFEWGGIQICSLSTFPFYSLNLLASAAGFTVWGQWQWRHTTPTIEFDICTPFAL